MEFTGIMEGKKHIFFVKLDKPEEFNILQPYFLMTDSEHTRKGCINKMECLFSGAVWYGTQRHGYGYSLSADVYGTLCDIIRKLYKGKIIDGGALDAALSAWNTHDDKVTFDEAALEELGELNATELQKKWGGE